MALVEVARRILLVAVGMAAAGEPCEHCDRSQPGNEGDDRPDRVGDGGEGQCYFFSTTIVFIDAVTPSATSTTTT